MTDHNTCSRCGRSYTWCNCTGDEPATEGASGPITGRTLWRAAVAMQRLGLPIATGAERPDIERHIDTGRVNPERGKGGTAPDLYVKSTGP